MPVSADKVMRQAKAFARKGAVEEARRLYEDILARYPANRRAREELASLDDAAGGKAAGGGLSHEQATALLQLYRQGRLKEALAQSTHLARRHPNEAFLQNLLGAIHNALGETERAVAFYQRAVQLKPGDAEARNNLGDALNTLGRHDEAEAHLTKTLGMRPDFAEAHNNLGLAHLYRGDRDAAVRHFEKAVAIAPRYAECYRNLSNARTFEANDPLVGDMQRALDGGQCSDEERMQLSFALGKAFDDMDAPDRAFALIAQGNEIRKKQLGYRQADDRRLFAAIREAFAVPPEPVAADAEGKRPIFVVGMPRSGTTLVEQILASHPMVFGAGELDLLRKAALPVVKRRLGGDTAPVDAAELDLVAQAYRSGIAAFGAGEPAVVDKMRGNFRWIGFIASALPDARIVCLERDRQAIRWSIFKHYFPARGLGFAWDIADIDAYQDMHDGLMAFWHEAFPGRIHTVSYEALTADQERETRRLLEHCGLEWDPACLDFHETQRSVRTASALQARTPLYRGSSNDWRRYEAHLAALSAAG